LAPRNLASIRIGRVLTRATSQPGGQGRKSEKFRGWSRHARMSDAERWAGAGEGRKWWNASANHVDEAVHPLAKIDLQSYRSSTMEWTAPIIALAQSRDCPSYVADVADSASRAALHDRMTMPGRNCRVSPCRRPKHAFVSSLAVPSQALTAGRHGGPLPFRAAVDADSRSLFSREFSLSLRQTYSATFRSVHRARGKSSMSL